MTDGDQHLDDSSNCQEISWYTTQIDEAAASDSRFSMGLSLREKLGFQPWSDVPPDAPDEVKATCWAFDYRVEIEESGRRHVHLIPKDSFGERTDPPQISAVGKKVKTLWDHLLRGVCSPKSQARLAHLLFECGGAQRQQFGGVASDAYFAAADLWAYEMDSIEDLCTAERLAHAITDTARAERCLERLLDMAERELQQPRPRAGVVLRALEHAVRVPMCPERVDAVLELANAELAEVRERDDALALTYERRTDDESRSALWRRRVEAFIEAASSAGPGIVRLAFRQTALQIAEQSNIRELRERAAAELQATRGEDLGLMRVESASVLYREQIEGVRDSFIRGDNWQRALISFAHAGPLSGNVESNRAQVARNRAENALSAMLPQIVLGPDQLPIFEAVTDEDKFEADLVRFETQFIKLLIQPFTAALHQIVVKFGVPELSEIARFLVTWPGLTSRPTLVLVIARAMQRFWCGDSEGATYVLAPRIETLVRELILSTSRGLYKLQGTHKPGQYPGLGAMLAILPEEFVIDESRSRFLNAVLVEPLGFNVRNALAHGMNDYYDSGAAAILIHIALFLGTLVSISATSAAEPQATHDRP